ncbi:hypothetical protein BGX21_002494 [Mortierella sp. AD011]|nr:hypothetical protein BGX20_002226 [Mortierella sp. AD010]KAF9380010.1 hypothetical protein BGX21_002494 [Mortierella sp. AD011]
MSPINTTAPIDGTDPDQPPRPTLEAASSETGDTCACPPIDESKTEKEEEKEKEEEEEEGEEEEEEEADESKEEPDTTIPVFTTESPEVALWDVLQNPVPNEILEKFANEVWYMILSHVPATRLARLVLVSKAWKAMIERLPLWKDIVNQCELTALKPNSSMSLMKYVLGHMVLICDLCLSRSEKLGADVPLPVRRPDILGLTWMCMRCRDEYRSTHAEMMDLPDRAPKDEDVYEQGPCEKVTHNKRYNGRRYGGGWGRGYGSYRRDCGNFDDFDEFDSDDEDDYYGSDYEDYESDYDDYEYDYFRPTWKNNANKNSWLNEVLHRGRSLLLKTMLGRYGLKVRGDSRLCTDFIDGTKYCPSKIVVVMHEMSWYFSSTDYHIYTKRSSVETAKAMAVAEWTRMFYDEHNELSLEKLKTLAKSPPETLLPMITLALEKHKEFSQKRELEKIEREAERQARILAKKLKALEKEAKKAQAEEKNSGSAENNKEAEEEGDTDENPEDSDSDEDDYFDEDDYYDEDQDEFHARVSVCNDLLGKFSFKVDCSIKLV